MSGSIGLVDVEGLYQGAPYPYAATVSANTRLVFLAGACPLDADGRTVAVGDHVGQAEACLANMRATLTAAGATIDDVVFLRVLVASTERAELTAVWNAVHGALGGRGVPATLLGVTVLGWEHQLVEVEAVAALAA